MVVFGAVEEVDVTVDVGDEADVVDAAPAAGIVSLFVTVKVLAHIFNGPKQSKYQERPCF